MEEIKDDELFKPNKLYLLYRRGQPEHIKALYEKGEVYINTIDYIRTCDDNAERSDPEDGILSRAFLGEAKLTFGPPGDFSQHGLPMYTNNLVETTDHIDTEKGNIYCLTGILGRDLMGPNGERPTREFNTGALGKSLIVIHKPYEFLRRVLKGLKERGFDDIQYRPVKYHPYNYSGRVGFFRKLERFTYQKEFRIFVRNEINDLFVLSIGSLEDIAIIENNTTLNLPWQDYNSPTIINQLIKIS